jgi:hypothetical protein
MALSAGLAITKSEVPDESGNYEKPPWKVAAGL